MKTNKEFTKWLKSHNACSAGMREVGTQTPEEFLKMCPRADWLLWWIGRAVNENLPGYPTLQQFKKCAIEIARKVKYLVKDDRINKVYELLDQYLLTENKDFAIQASDLAHTIRRAAADAAYAAADAAYAAAAAAYAAADAAYAADADADAAAAYAAYAADSAAAYAADAYAYAAYADAYAADADAAAAAYADAADARDKMRLECADLVRQYLIIKF